MKFPLIITAFVLSSSLIFAQKDLDQSTVDAASFFEKDWSIGINYGITQFDGDIRQYDYSSSVQTGLDYQDSDFKELRSAFSLSLEKKINEKVSFSIEYVNGEFAGLRRPNEYEGYEIDYPYEIAEGSRDGNKFVTSFNEADILLNYDLNSNIEKLIKTELPKNISVILKIGFGYNSFRSLRTNLYTDDYVYSFGYDELTKNESKDPVSESVLVAGTKLKYKFEKGISLVLDYTIRVINSDKWDSSIMEGGQGKDRFSFLSFGLSYDIGKINKAK